MYTHPIFISSLFSDPNLPQQTQMISTEPGYDGCRYVRDRVHQQVQQKAIKNFR